MAVSSPRTLTGPTPEPETDATLWLAYVAAARRAQAEPFAIADGLAARRAWGAFMAAGGALPGEPVPDVEQRRYPGVGL